MNEEKKEHMAQIIPFRKRETPKVENPYDRFDVTTLSGLLIKWTIVLSTMGLDKNLKEEGRLMIMALKTKDPESAEIYDKTLKELEKVNV